MKYLLFFSLILSCSFIFAQGTFSITGQLKHSKRGHKIYLEYKANGIDCVRDSCCISDSLQFYFKGQLNEPVEAYLLMKPAKESEEENWFSFYIAPGDSIQLHSASVLGKASLSGSLINEESLALCSLTAPLLEKVASKLLEKEELMSAPLKNKYLIRRAGIQYQQLKNKLMEFSLKFVASHPDSYISLIPLLEAAALPAYRQRAERLFRVLNSYLITTRLGIQIAVLLRNKENQ